MNVVSLGEGGSSPLSNLLFQKLCVELEEYRANADWVRRNYPALTPKPAHDLPLAIVGGGVSAADHLDELRSWPGHIWSIKGAVKWLKENGVGSTVVSCHPKYSGEDWPDFADAALMDAGCPRAAFERLKCPVLLFETFAVADRTIGGPTTFSKTPHLALQLGYREIHLFGADSSMTERSHAYENRHSCEQLMVRCGDEDFLSQPDWIWQAEHLVEWCKAAPQVFRNRSGGLLKAMIASGGEYRIIGVSEALARKTNANLPVFRVI